MRILDETSAAHDVAAKHGFTRAGFLKAGGALLVGLTLPGAVATSGAVAQAADTGPLSWPMVDPSQAGSWLAIQADGSVTAFTGKVELGMGNQTSLAQLVAEQLDVAFDRITLVMGDTATCVNQGVTAASATIRVGGAQLSLAAAGGRRALLGLASAQLGAPVESLVVSNGTVSVNGDASRSVTYGDLVKGQVLTATFPVTPNPPTANATINAGSVPLKAVSDYKVVGTSVPRVDIPLKVAANYEYIQDVKVPGMLHGRVIRPPSLGAKLISYGTPPAGVRVVRQNDFLGVVAEREWDAIQAATDLETKWTTWSGLPTPEGTSQFLRKTTSQDRVMAQAGNVDAGMAGASKQLLASYETAVETHGSIGPSCAIVDAKDGFAMVWSGTQGPNSVQQSVATVLGLPLSGVRVITYPASGCYGRNGGDPATVDAAIMSKLAGAPVRVQWMRADEHGWDPKGPATVQDLQGGLDAAGNMVAFGHQAWLPAQFNTTIIGGVLSGTSVAMTNFGGWAGTLNYNVPNKLLVAHNQNNLASENNNGVGMISAWLRSPSQFQLTFAMESFIDELAHAAGADPVDFRLRQLSDPRLVAVLTAVAKLAQWKPGPAAQKTKGTGVATGRGVAVSLRDGTYNAEIADVEVDRETGEIRVKHVYVAEDHGLTVNPRACVLGIEAGIVQTVSRTLLEQVRYTESAVTSVDWETYPILTFSGAPKVTTHIIERAELPATGVGEAHCCPVAAAVGNAVFDAVGIRLRALPMLPARVKQALAAAKA
jgi:nicotinate dehydrogenase subunit B